VRENRLGTFQSILQTELVSDSFAYSTADVPAFPSDSSSFSDQYRP
jgi:hypothetical protein